MTKLAIVQRSPVFLNKEKTILKAVASVKEAAAEAADLVVFTEAFIPDYRPGSGGSGLALTGVCPGSYTNVY